MLVAGEHSGDALGGRLMAGLKLRTGGQVEFHGVGGRYMHEQGLHSLFPMEDLSVMGLAEILPQVPRILRRLSETAALAMRLRPDAVVTIDAQGFAFRLARRLRGRGIPLVHYVAPTVWAWRPARAGHIARVFDHLLVMLPFEPPYFEREGLPTTFVGHPVVESGADRGRGRQFRARHGIDPAATLLCVLPGSRMGEVRRLLPVFGAALGLLKQRFPELGVVMPTLGSVAGPVNAAAAGWPAPAVVLQDSGEKYDAMAASDAALAASGTVSLELAMARVPTVIAYRMNPLTAAAARRLLRVPYINMVNLIVDRPVIPELLQQDCTPAKLAEALCRILTDPAARAAQMEAAEAVGRTLGQGGEPPSLRAADALLAAIEAGPRRR